MQNEVIIIGAGGHGKVIADIVLASGDRVLGFLDDCAGACIKGFPWLGKTEDFYHFPDVHFFAAIGSAQIRENVAKKLHGVCWYTAIHPHAIISPLDVEIGEGTAVMAGAVVNPGARIGRHCIINTSSVIEHDNQVDDFVHVSVGARLAGTVSVGKRTWIGIGASVRNNLAICEDVMIGMGSVVTKDIVRPGIYVGVPASLHKAPA